MWKLAVHSWRSAMLDSPARQAGQSVPCYSLGIYLAETTG